MKTGGLISGAESQKVRASKQIARRGRNEARPGRIPRQLQASQGRQSSSSKMRAGDGIRIDNDQLGKVTDQEMESLRLKRDKFHGDWNYAIEPRPKQYS
jgi:hypothetical protein